MLRYAMIAAALLALVGCAVKKSGAPGSSRTEVKTDQGKITVQQRGDRVTQQVTDKSGNRVDFEAGKGLDLSKLGVPVYPGAKLAEEHGSAVSVTHSEGSGAAVESISSDPPAKVLAWYAPPLKNAQTASTPEGGSVSGTDADGNMVAVVVSAEDGKSRITATVVQEQ